MAKIQDEILDSFVAKLNESSAVKQHMIDGLRQLFSSDKKPKADDIVKVLTADSDSGNDQ